MRLVFLICFSLIFHAATAQCEDSIVNCTGECGQFEDENNDGLCDIGLIDSSLLKLPVKTAEPVEHKETVVTTMQPKKAKKQDSTVTYRFDNTATKAIEQQEVPLPVQENVQQEAKPEPEQLASPAIPPGHKHQKRGLKKHSSYHFLSIGIPLLVLYVGTDAAVKRKLITKAWFLRFWNLLLLITFVVSALLGLLITAKINYQLTIPYIKPIYVFHVDFGVAMSIICLFHVVKHWSFYTRMFQQRSPAGQRPGIHARHA